MADEPVRQSHQSGSWPAAEEHQHPAPAITDKTTFSWSVVVGLITAAVLGAGGIALANAASTKADKLETKTAAHDVSLERHEVELKHLVEGLAKVDAKLEKIADAVGAKK